MIIGDELNIKAKREYEAMNPSRKEFIENFDPEADYLPLVMM